MSPSIDQDPSDLAELPSDEVRRIMWRFQDRPELHRVASSARAVARGLVARMVAAGARSTHEWTEEKQQMLVAFDEAGITSIFVDPAQGGFIAGPKNLAMALAAFELAWVDGGAATCSLATALALAPILERGTAAQRDAYLRRAAPPAPGEDRPIARGAFCLTEPLPHVGVDTGVLSGRVRIASWPKGGAPVLAVAKRGRFINNMDFATFVVAAVESDDPRIRGTCMVILEDGDKGIFDRGAPSQKLVHQLSSTRDPRFELEVPADRIVGGYDVVDGVLVPRHSHAKILEAVFARTRVPVGIMTAAKLLSAVEPIIRYQRGRFRGGERSPGTPRHDLGLQMKEDALQRLIDVWALGEAAAALGFAAARHFDEFDALDRRRDELLRSAGGGTPEARAPLQQAATARALEYLRLAARPADEVDTVRLAELGEDLLVRWVIQDSVAAVLSPATKLWNTGQGATAMREAVSLMGGQGITEDCPGFLALKWFDAQLEATYEGPESVQRRVLITTMTDELFLAQFRLWIEEMRAIGANKPGSGACTLATAMELWQWTLRHLRHAVDADGKPVYRDARQGATFPLADALCWLLAARAQVLDTRELEGRQAVGATRDERLFRHARFFTDLCHVQCARAAGEVGRICAELVFGYQRHPSWDPGCQACYQASEVDELESIMPGLTAGVFGRGEVIEADGSHPMRAGPCARFAGLETFQRLRSKLDGCLTGARLAKDRAGLALTRVRIPEALDY